MMVPVGGQADASLFFSSKKSEQKTPPCQRSFAILRAGPLETRFAQTDKQSFPRETWAALMCDPDKYIFPVIHTSRT